MKFKLNIVDGAPTITQFESVQVSCSDKVMSEVMALLPGQDVVRDPTRHYSAISTLRKRNGDGDGELLMFRSGAKLYPSDGRTGFRIYCYHYAGADGHQAIAELRIGYLMRDLQRQSDIMWGPCFKKLPAASIEFVWPRDRKAGGA